MRVAVVGTGISGLYAARQLAPRCELTLFEAQGHAGGHSNTVEVAMDGQRFAIDTGFIVFNEKTYPLFTALLQSLGVAYQPSEMSFSFRCAASGLEYRGDNTFDALFAQRRNAFRPSFYGMLRDILRFNSLGAELVVADPAVTLGTFLADRKLRGKLLDDYLLPMAGAIWSAEPSRILAFPAAHFGRFFQNHGLLQVEGRPQWLTVTGGSREYVRALLRPLRDRLQLDTPVEWVERHPDRVVVKARGRPAAEYDQVIMACHSDQALALLRDPSGAEREVLGAIAYQDNDAVLHTDERLLPRRRRAWASWNYHRRPAATATSRVAVTYNLTRLQSLPTRRQFLLTLNADETIDPRTVLHRQTYSHPVFDSAALRAQGRHGEINGAHRTWYCGAYWGYGFHEDGVRSAAGVCSALNKDLEKFLAPAPERETADAQLYLSGTR
ncbi:MAG: FAD-dependent oxidoreductase [Gammaproteobacteria bacterium]|nr:FAD-dependent oxidoreductase [Gammaproteobacteria bacterium]